MHSVLLIAQKPQASEDGLVVDPRERDNWRKLVVLAADALKQVQGSQQLAESTWLLPLKNGLNPLARLVILCEQLQFSCRALFFDVEPQWVTTFKPAASAT